MMAHLLVEMTARLEARIEDKADATLRKMKAGIETIQEKMDDEQKEMKGQVGSLTSWTDVSHKEMKAMLKTCLEKTETRIETGQEAREALMQVSLEWPVYKR
jgi:chaperonin cofactor prefoldin